MHNPRITTPRRSVFALCLFVLWLSTAAHTAAHPLGNFTVNHFARLELDGQRVRVHYVVDMAEIPTFQEKLNLDADGDGQITPAELETYALRTAHVYADALTVTIDDTRVPLALAAHNISLPAGAANLPTLRLECDYAGTWPAAATARPHRLHFEDANYKERVGWHEIVVVPASGLQVFDSTAFGTGLSNELRAYPNDRLAAPLDERTADLSFAATAPPAGARPLVARDGRKVEPPARDRLAELIAVPELTVGVALFGLLLAAVLGGFHAMSPGHGKTVVAAYLIGSRGTAKHAAFLGLTVTITHTAGVFALGLVTLFAAQYVVPERLYPILSFISGAIVVLIGLSLFARRLGASLGIVPHEHEHTHEHEGAHEHGGRAHTHLPPGADGEPVTWRRLLALGISGGLLPCPSALVVLLSAISLHRVGYGLLLVVAFSFGLASALTGIGLLFVYARRWVARPMASAGALVRVLPVLSALVITCAGLFICYEAVGQAGYSLRGVIASVAGQYRTLFNGGEPAFASTSALAVLTLGLIFGLKHATEVDHVVAVTTIVSEHKKLWRAALVGGLWGAGHTASLVVVGTIVLVLRVAIPERVSSWLEFCVALMIIMLGLVAFTRALRSRGAVHVHKHRHDGLTHAHVHFHDEQTAHEEPAPAHSHAVRRIGIKPLLVGAMHGLAGSAALTLLVLTQIASPFVGLLYLLVFGLGSIVGMLLMSGLVSLPFVLTARKLDRFHYGLQTVAGALSICFGLWYAYETGIASGLLMKG
ncbi:MAG TPA: sulfite exporter TauE/SafE family protein [Pyrinomonadaceae bacterium]|jgi:ABC-type nickel/cobalt efflux system permease component RcnA